MRRSWPRWPRARGALRRAATASTGPGRRRVDSGGRPIRSDPSRTAGKVRTDPRPTDPGGGRHATKPVLRPKQFGRYYLVDRLGEGGMAEIYTAVAFGAENFRR